MEKYLYIGATLGLTVFAQLILKQRALTFASTGGMRKIDYILAMYTDVGVLSGLAAGVVASVFWALALEKSALSLAYPFMALSFVLVPAAASLLFHEAITVFQLVGLGLIVAGVTINALAQ